MDMLHYYGLVHLIVREKTQVTILKVMVIILLLTERFILTNVLKPGFLESLHLISSQSEKKIAVGFVVKTKNI